MGAANKLYNGNIAETFWSTATDGGFVRNYGYKYDNLNRLKDATYQKSGQLTGMYNENLSYDKNGNIMNLSRYGDRDEQYLPIQIDNLQYGYATNSNKLMSVVDNSNNTSGFKDGITTGDDYVYDANGNMTVDKNKNITSIVYNHLNLPTKIIFPTGNIVYFYNASGQKVQKVVTENTTVTTTDYLGGYQYQNTVLQFFPTAEGYVKNTPVSGINTYSYVFNYTDHLGNTRLSYAKDTTTGSLKILEENNYYPFGLKHNSYNVDNFQPDYKYQYNGKELQDELGLNMTAMDYRQYDNTLARFVGIDLLSELSYSESPNHFGHNNPIFWRDPSGLWSYSAFGNADKNINMNNAQWLASQRPSDSPESQLNLYEKNRIANQHNAPSIGSQFGGRGKLLFSFDTEDENHYYVHNFYESYFRNQGLVNYYPVFENSKIALDFVGGLYGALEIMTYNGGYWLGDNGKYYSNNWRGNQYTGNRSLALKAAINYKWAGKAVVGASVAIGAYETYNGYQMDGGHFGYNAQSAAASTTGSIIGGYVGASEGVAAGASIGAFFGGIGAIPGAIIGGFIGGFGGSYVGGEIGQGTVNYIHR